VLRVHVPLPPCTEQLNGGTVHAEEQGEISCSTVTVGAVRCPGKYASGNVECFSHPDRSKVFEVQRCNCDFEIGLA
jgi:hypothetical protein